MVSADLSVPFCKQYLSMILYLFILLDGLCSIIATKADTINFPCKNVEVIGSKRLEKVLCFGFS